MYLATDPDREGEAISLAPEAAAGPAGGQDLPGHLQRDHPARWSPRASASPGTSTRTWWTPSRPGASWTASWAMSSSPLLWKKIRRGLSAGRVQSVATRLVADREEEIRALSCPRSTGPLDAPGPDSDPSWARLQGPVTTAAAEENESSTARRWTDIVAELQDAPFAVSNVKRTEKHRYPAPPFTTSTLQQEASRKLNMTPRRTMAIAQQLYEGVDIDRRGHRGPHHLYAYRLPAAVRGGPGRGQAASLRAATASEYYPAGGPGTTRPRPAPRTPTRPSAPAT